MGVRWDRYVDRLDIHLEALLEDRAERRPSWHGLLPCPREVLVELDVKDGGVDETRTRDLRRDRPAF